MIFKIFFLLHTILPSFLETDSSSIIIWDSNYHLKKQDFRLKPPDDKIGTFAEAYCGIAVSFTNDNDFLEYRVVAFVNRDSSWISDTTFTIEYSQLHFNVTEKYARLLRKELASISSMQK